MIATLTMCSLEFDEKYIPHFLDYYDKQGVDRHFLILHSKEEVDEEWFQSKYSSERVNVFFAYGEWNCIFLEEIKHNILKEMKVSKNDWIINSDIDEQIEPRHGTIRDKVRELEDNGENCCVGLIVDKIATNGLLPEITPDLNYDGTLPEITPDNTLSKQFPLESNLTRVIVRGNTKKVPITRGDMNVQGGAHELIEESRKIAKRNHEILIIYHYKWSANVLTKLEERVQTHKKFRHWRESERFLTFWNRFAHLSPKKDLVKQNKDICFMATPKCGSTSFSSFCAKNHIEFIKHNYQLHFIEASVRHRRTIYVLRNPVERFTSAYCYLQKSTERKKIHGHQDYIDWTRFCRRFDDINDFVKNGLEEASQKQLHFLPQSFWVNMSKHPIFLSLDDIDADLKNFCDEFGFQFSSLPHRNKGSYHDIQLDPESINKINEIYKDDVQLYLSHINSQR